MSYSSLIQTPWGLAQHVEQVAPGIRRVSTASHGGYHVSRDLLDRIPGQFRGGTSYSPPGWFEEDSDWLIVALSFPEHFSAPNPYDPDGLSPYQVAVKCANLLARRGEYLADAAEVFGVLREE